jgi:sulfofructose kinase
LTTSVDVLGIGLNATDTLILLSEFPPYAGKVAFERELLSPGGQVATAIVACAKLGARTKYIGTIGDDLRGRVQRESLDGTGVDTSGLITRTGCPNQTAYILIDQRTGERTVLWQRDGSLRLSSSEIDPADIAGCRLLHIDGYDTEAAAFAAGVARKYGIPVSLDVDTVYPNFEPVLKNVDILVASSVWPARWTGETDPFVALALLQREYGMRIAAMTLGEHGSLALTAGAPGAGTYTYSPAFRVHTVDTTGAGDVFHGALCVALLAETPMQEALDFSNAAAALNCTAIGARGHIASRGEVEALLASSAASSENRRIDPEIAERCGTRVAVASSSTTRR